MAYCSVKHKLIIGNRNTLLYILFSIITALPLRSDAQSSVAHGFQLLEEGKCLLEIDSLSKSAHFLKAAYESLKHTPNHLQAAEALSLLANVELSKGTDWLLAKRLYLKALKIQLQHLDSTALPVINNLSELGDLYHRLRVCDSAVYFGRTAIRLYRDQEPALFTTYSAGLHNRLGNALLCNGEYESAKKSFEKAYTINDSLLGPVHHETVITIDNMAAAALSNKDLKKGITLYKQGIALWEKMEKPDLPELSTAYNNIAFGLFYDGKLPQGIAYLKKALAISMKGVKEENLHVEVANQLNNLAVFYRRSGNHVKAALYQEWALTISLRSLPPEHPTIPVHMSNLGSSYLEISQLEQGIHWLEKALDTQKKYTDVQDRSTAIILMSLGQAYADQQQFQLADSLLHQSLKIMIGSMGERHPEVANIRMARAEYLVKKGDFSTALEQLQIALEIRQEAFELSHPEIAQTLLEIGKAQVEMGEAGQAKKSFERALFANAYDPEEPYNFDVVLKPSTLLITLQQQLISSKKDYDRNPGPLIRQAILDQIAVADSLIGYRWSQLDEHQSKSKLLAQSKQFYELVLLLVSDRQDDSALSYDDLTLIFNIMERSKSLLLLEALQTEEVEVFAGIPDSLLEREKKLQQKIDSLEIKRFQGALAGQENRVDFTAHDLRALLTSKEELAGIIDTWKNFFRPYYDLRFKRQSITLSELQARLSDSEQTLLEFFTGQEHLFLLLIRHDQVHLQVVRKDFPLAQWVSDLRRGIYGFQMEQQPLSQYAYSQLYAQAATQLYEKLIRSVQTRLTKKVTIIPDGILAYVPFDVLLKETPQYPDEFRHHAYLLYDHVFSYAHSAGLLKLMEERTYTDDRKTWMGLAPQFSGTECFAMRSVTPYLLNGEYCALPNNRKEVRSIGQLVGGNILLDQQASKTEFLNQASDFKMIHLATHARADDKQGDFSFLIFQPDSAARAFSEILFAKDIYQLPLRAEMVVLSACETGGGELNGGEGVISLARGFSYAGAKSLITTYWPVDDAAAEHLMISFYKNLKKGQAKDEALWNTKLAYLHDERHEVNPFYWAGWVAVGDMSAVYEPSNYRWVLSVLGCLLFLIFFVIIKSQSKRTFAKG